MHFLFPSSVQIVTSSQTSFSVSDHTVPLFLDNSLKAKINPHHWMTNLIVYVEHMTVYIIVFLFDVHNHVEYFDKQYTVLSSLLYL